MTAIIYPRSQYTASDVRDSGRNGDGGVPEVELCLRLCGPSTATGCGDRDGSCGGGCGGGDGGGIDGGAFKSTAPVKEWASVGNSGGDWEREDDRGQGTVAGNGGRVAKEGLSVRLQ